jgi:alkylglycerol monooxygenase
MLNPIALSIPLFLGTITAELLAAWRAKKPWYRALSFGSDLGCGIQSQAWGLLYEPAMVAIHVGVYETLRVGDLPATPAIWLLNFVLVDFLYYWWHRASHRVNFMWAAHVVHHQSEDYNLAVALRQSAITGLTSMPFYLPLALLGFPPLVTLTNIALNTLYQYWIHTRFVRTLGPLEWVMNTASHHRVHHGINPEYIDKNHAGVFIVWDRLFGTFVPERHEPTYGTVEGFESTSPTWATFEPWVKLHRLAATFPKWTDRVQLYLRPPEWRPGGDVFIPPVQGHPPPRWNPAIPTVRALQAGLSIVLLSSLLMVTLLFVEELSPVALAGLVALMLLGVEGVGRLLRAPT